MRACVAAREQHFRVEYPFTIEQRCQTPFPFGGSWQLCFQYHCALGVSWSVMQWLRVNMRLLLLLLQHSMPGVSPLKRNQFNYNA